MKKLFNIVFSFAAAVIVTSCLGDNYEQPNAGFYGKAIDAETGDVILQDIGGEGSLIEVVEKAYENPETRRLNFKTDGTYQDKGFFKGKYKVSFSRVNFNPATVVLKSSNGAITDNEIIEIDGDTEMNIEALPWCRISLKEDGIVFDEARQRVVARFSVECTTTDPLLEVGLFCDPSPHVSYSINGYGDKSTQKVSVNRVLNAPTDFTLKMPLTLFEAKDSDKDFYFRVGAHTSVTDARWNYAPAVRVHIVKKEVEQKKLGMRWDLFDSPYKAMWEAGKHKTVANFEFDTKDYKSGDGSYAITSFPIEEGKDYVYTQFISPGEGKGGIKPVFDISSIPESGCHMLLTLYVSDASHFERDAHGQIELGSAGIFDEEEICWIFGQFELRNGWQTLDLSLPEGNGGGLRRNRVNWFRFYHTHEKVGNTTVKFDEIRFYYKTMVESCDASGGWKGSGGVVVDEGDMQEGEASISTTNNANVISIEKTWSRIIVPATKEKGHFEFWLYVSDAAQFNSSETQVEIGSAQKADANELHWRLPALKDGWNKVDLKLTDAIGVGGEMDLKNMNWFRVYGLMSAPAGSVTAKVDRLRFYEEGADLTLADFNE